MREQVGGLECGARSGAEVLVERELFCEIGDLEANVLKGCGVVAVFEGGDDPLGDLTHLVRAHAAGGEGRGADADAAGLHGRVGVVGDGIFVDGDAGFAEGVFGLGAEHTFLEYVDEQDVGVGAAGDDAQALLRQLRCEELGIGDDLRGVLLETGVEGFFEGDGLSGDDVHERATLLPGEDAAIDGGGKLLLAEDEAGAWSAQRLVRGGGDDVRVRDRRGMGVAGDESGEVGHIYEEVCADFVGDGAHAFEIELSRVGAAAADEELGLLADGLGFEFIVVDDFGIFADLVAGNAVELAGEVELVAVCEVAAVGEVETEDGIAGLEQRHEGGGVGL